ALRTTSLRLAI
ncbi:unnamed protein product, partial [Allacma fusca]